MIAVKTTEEITLTTIGTSLEGNTTETQLEVGTDVTWWMSEPVRNGFGVDMVWKVELEGWVGTPEDRTTNPRVNFKEVSPFYNIKLFNEDGTPKYPFTSSELPYIYGLVEGQTNLVIKFLEENNIFPTGSLSVIL